ncbi:hypothetical protein D3C78_686510 [compost metagenome]
MQIAHPHVVIGQVISEVLGHTLGQGGDQYPLLHRHTLADFREQVVDLGGSRTHFNLRVDQTGRTHHLLHDSASMLGLIVAWRGRNEDGLRADAFPFIETHGPVVQRRWQAEAVLDQGFLARAVALVHRAYLGNADVGLVDHQQ